MPQRPYDILDIRLTSLRICTSRAFLLPLLKSRWRGARPRAADVVAATLVGTMRYPAPSHIRRQPVKTTKHKTKTATFENLVFQR